MRLLIAAAYGVYTALIVFFFGSTFFLNPSLKGILFYPVLIGLVVLFEFVILTWVKQKAGNQQLMRAVFALSFELVGVISSLIVWLWFKSEESSYLLFLTTFLVAALLPTMLVILYLVFNVATTRINSNLEKVVPQEEVELFVLESETGKTLLKATMQQLISFEANDNYVIIYYFDKNNHVKKVMERFSLKKMEEMLAPSSILFERVHKSFLINPNYLVNIKGKAQAYKLELRGLEELVPVSRSYAIERLEQLLIEQQ